MEALLVIFALAAVVWALVYAWRGSLMLGCVATVLFGYTFTNHFWRIEVGPISLNVGRLLIVGLLLLLIWRWKQGLLPRRPLVGSDWLVVLFTGYVTLRFITTPSPEGIEPNVPPTWRFFACFLFPVLLYLVARCGKYNQQGWKLVLATLSCFGVYLATTAVAEVAGWWWAVLPRYISDPTLGLHFGRARGPALNSVSLGLLLAVCFWASWFLSARVNRPWRLLLAGTMGLTCVGLYLTFTRSSWLALALTLAVIPLLHAPRAWRPVLLTGTLVAGMLAAVFIGGKLINIDRHDTDGSASHSVYQRQSILIVSMRMFADAPLVGCGLGRFYDKKLPYLADRSQQLELESIRDLDHHNTFLSVLTETGLIGVSLFLGVIVAWGRVAWQLARDAMAEPWVRAHGLFTLAVLMVYSTNAMFHDLTLMPSEQWLLFLVGGAVVGLHGSLRVNAFANNPGEQLAQSPRVATRGLCRT